MRGAEPMSRRVLVVRPYGAAIRNRVFALLGTAGYRVAPEDVIPTGTPDAEAVRLVLASPLRTLLVPFHGHRDEHGANVDGAHFLGHLDQAAGSFRWRVLMPVSRFGGAGFTLAMESEALAHLRGAVLPLPLDDLDQPGLARRIARHLEPRTA